MSVSGRYLIESNEAGEEFSPKLPGNTYDAINNNSLPGDSMDKEEQNRLEVQSYSDTVKGLLVNALFYGITCFVILELASWVPWLAITGFVIYALFTARSTIRSATVVIGSSTGAFSNPPPSLKRCLASFVMSVDALLMVGCSVFLCGHLF